jgi:acetoin utilization protein AcuB
MDSWAWRRDSGASVLMLVSEIMTANPITIHPQATLREALEVMDTHEFHHLPVLSLEKHLIGVVTAHECRLALRLPELARFEWERLPQVDRLRVRDVMSPTLVTADQHMSAQEAAKVMLTNYVSCLPVLLDETIVGIITISDILIAFVQTMGQVST